MLLNNLFCFIKFGEWFAKVEEGPYVWYKCKLVCSVRGVLVFIPTVCIAI